MESGDRNRRARPDRSGHVAVFDDPRDVFSLARHLS